jgi:vacuolar-type H+-ATPase subunit I/STV1
LEQAKTGSDAQIKAFKALGISAKEFANMSTEQALEAVSKAMANGKDSATTMAAATQLLGAESTRLRGVLIELGEKGVDNLKDGLKDLAYIMTDDVVRAGNKMEENLSRNFQALKTSAQSQFIKILPGLTYQILSAADFVGERVGAGGGRAQRFSTGLFGYETPGTRSRGEVQQIKREEEEARRLAKEAADQEIYDMERKLRLEKLTAKQRVDVLKIQLDARRKYEAAAENEEERVKRAKDRIKIEEEYVRAVKDLQKEQEALAELEKKMAEFKRGEIQPNERLLQIDQERADLQEQIAKLSSDQIEKRVELGNKVLELSKEEREIQEQIMASMSKLLRMGREGGENIADFFKDFFSGWTGKAEAPAGVDALRRIGGSSLGGVAGRKETREEKLVSLTSNLLKTLQDAKSALIKIEQKAGGGRYR